MAWTGFGGSIGGALGPGFGGGTYTLHYLTWQPDFGPHPDWGKAPIAPSAPSPTATQQTLPTSKFGDTIPVVWGVCRVPGAYIWAPDFEKDGSSGEVITTLRARLRFARPLESNSNWRLRRLWSNGKLILNKATGYRSPLISRLVAYDGQLRQGRDKLQVEVEGEDNVSAHRGYLDMVITMQLSGDRQPPSFDAEWIQDPETGIEVDEFETFISNGIHTNPSLTGTGYWWGITVVDVAEAYLRKFNINELHEVYSVPITTGSGHTLQYLGKVRYIPSIDRVLTSVFVPGLFGGCWPALVNPVTGVMLEAANAVSGFSAGIAADLAVTWGTTGVYIFTISSAAQYGIFTFGADSITKVFEATTWPGGRAESWTLGEKRASDCDVFFCADDGKVYRAKLSMAGALTGITTFATFSDDPRYAVYYEGDLVVFDAGGNVTKLDGTTGAIIWTAATPYVIGTSAFRGLNEPDFHNLLDEFYIQDPTHYYFTSLEDGSTRTIGKAIDIVNSSNIFDASQNVAITTNNGPAPLRRLFDSIGSGCARDLEDLLAA